MVTVYDVRPNPLIDKAAEELETEYDIDEPDFAGLVKTGAHAERPPEQENFWYIRCASILRQAYTKGPIGVERLRKHYGGSSDQGSAPNHHYKAGGSTIRKAMQELEENGLLEKTGEGRVITSKGKKFLDNLAEEIKLD